MNDRELISAIEAILFAAGDPVPAKRIALVLEAELSAVFSAAKTLSAELEADMRGTRLLILGEKLQLCSASEYSQVIIRTLEQRKTPKLTQPALEVLAITAYFQPVTRAYIEQVRGVDSSFTISSLSDRGLIAPSGKLEAPGRPTLYATTDTFLRVMSVKSLSELPKIGDLSTDEGIIALQNSIDELKNSELEGQLSISGEV